MGQYLKYRDKLEKEALTEGLVRSHFVGSINFSSGTRVWQNSTSDLDATPTVVTTEVVVGDVTGGSGLPKLTIPSAKKGTYFVQTMARYYTSGTTDAYCYIKMNGELIKLTDPHYVDNATGRPTYGSATFTLNSDLPTVDAELKISHNSTGTIVAIVEKIAIYYYPPKSEAIIW